MKGDTTETGMPLYGALKRREGFKCVMSLKGRERFVAMIEHQGRVFVTSTKCVYQLRGGKIRKIPIETEER